MLVSAAYILEPDILLSAAGKENLDLLNEKLLGSQPETLMLLGKHGSWQEDQLSLDLSDKYLVQERDFYPDFQTIETLQREIRMMDYPLTLDSHGQLEEGFAVFLREWPKMTLIPVSWSGFSHDLHEEIGQCMKNFIIDSPKRISVLAFKQDEQCRANSILTGMLKMIQMKEINIANQAIFYGG